jgi:hypothetical protein
MNIFDRYPDSVEVKGKEYALDLAFDRVLCAIDAADDPGLMATDRLAVQCALVLDDNEDMPDDPGEQAEIIKAVFELFPKPEKQSGERYLDFHQDAAMIRSGFMRAYGIDLTRDTIHFIQFLELLSDLPSDTALMRTIEIRQRPLPKPNKHNAEQIAALQKAKARVAIRMSEDERRARFAESLKNSTVLRG